MTQQRVEFGLPSTSTGGGCASGACGCGGASASTSAATTPAATTTAATTTVRVEGMTCAHCVRAVTDELNAVEGVTVVDVDLHAGETSTVRFTTSRPVGDEEIAAAIDEAGYTVAR